MSNKPFDLEDINQEHVRDIKDLISDLQPKHRIMIFDHVMKEIQKDFPEYPDMYRLGVIATLKKTLKIIGTEQK